MPVVVAGFEPLDVLFGIDRLLAQLKEDKPKLENEYGRAVKYEGNLKALQLIDQAFDVINGNWRGLGCLPSSAFILKDEFENLDARKKHGVKVEEGRDLLPGCQCHLVMIGKIKPSECPLFMHNCTPETPKGACMVSMEGTCRIWFRHGVK
jgi:hydrogenase expression/formation protein HypD